MDIAYFDLDRDIFWVRRDDDDDFDVYYLEPHSLEGNRRRISKEYPVWRFSEEAKSSYSHFFDGEHWYSIGDGNHLRSSDKDGNVYDWGLNDADCIEVNNGHLFFNGKVYDLTLRPSEPIGEDWLGHIDDWLEQHFTEDEAPQEYVEEEEDEAPLGYIEEEEDVFYEEDLVDIEDEEDIEGADLVTEKSLDKVDIKYNICKLGAEFDVGAGKPVILEINGNEYPRKMHSHIKGRIDGMKQVYEENGLGLGDALWAEYYAEEGRILLTQI